MGPAPLLRVESPALRSTLGLKQGTNYISPHQLAHSTLEEPPHGTQAAVSDVGQESVDLWSNLARS